MRTEEIICKIDTLTYQAQLTKITVKSVSFHEGKNKSGFPKLDCLKVEVKYLATRDLPEVALVITFFMTLFTIQRKN